MPQDALRSGGEAAITARSTGWCGATASALEPALEAPAMAFNLTVLSNLLGTPLEPDFTGVDLLIEDVSEQLYRIDRTHVPCRRPAKTSGRSADFGSAASPMCLPTTPHFASRRSRDRRGLVRPVGHPLRRPRRHRPRRPKSRRAVRAREIADSPLQRPLQRPPSCALPRGEQQEGLMAQERS